MDPNPGSLVVFDKFFPGADTFFEITLEGPECPFKGVTAPWTGTVCGEAVHTTRTNTFAPNLTGTLTKVQTLLFGKAQQETPGCALKLGKAGGQLSGAMDNALAGLNGGKPWGAD